jgi:hypothetical protein
MGSFTFESHGDGKGGWELFEFAFGGLILRRVEAEDLSFMVIFLDVGFEGIVMDGQSSGDLNIDLHLVLHPFCCGGGLRFLATTHY